MKTNRKHLALGIAVLGLAGAAVTGVGVAYAGTTPSAPTPMASASAPPYGPGMGAGHGRMAGQRVCLAGAAGYLGLSETDLLARLHEGKSLADVAAAKNKSVSGLKAAMLAAARSSLDADTTLTAEQRTEMLRRMESRIDDMIDRKHTPGMGRGMGGGWMHGTR